MFKIIEERLRTICNELGVEVLPNYTNYNKSIKTYKTNINDFAISLTEHEIVNLKIFSIEPIPSKKSFNDDANFILRGTINNEIA